MKKRLLSILLAACLLAGLLPTVALAEGTEARSTGYTVLSGPEGSGNLVDGDPETTWCMTLEEGSNPNVIFQTPQPLTITGYSITTGIDNAENPGRNPVGWRLYGSNDYSTDPLAGYSWMLLDEVSNDQVLEDKNTQKYDFLFSEMPTTSYKYYWLQVFGAKSGNTFQIGEFAVWRCEHEWEATGTVPPTEDEGSCIIYTCTKCGYQESRPDLDNSLVLELTDTNGGGWDKAQLNIHRDGEYWKSVTMESRGTTDVSQTETVVLPYSEDICYSFYWQKGKDDYHNELTIQAPKQNTKYFYSLWRYNDGDLMVRFNAGDYSGVDAAIASVPEDFSIYTEDSVKAVRDAISAVNWNLPSGRQDEIDAMAKAINDAIEALERNSQSVINMTEAKDDLYITETGYRWGANGTETPYADVYHLGGSSARHVIVESGNHEIMLYELHLRYSVEANFSPFIIKKGASVELTLLGKNEILNNGNNIVAGLNVAEGASLEITEQSTGSLTASAKYRGAGIGGNQGEGTGSITINGGTIKASSQTGASIGGGNSCTDASVIINGGTITAISSSGAGIGGGKGCTGKSDITINGGNITATSKDGAGIGGGMNNGGEITITINGGTINAKCQGSYAAGIGGGNGSPSKLTITIDGGSVEATGKYGAGIGTSYDCKTTPVIKINGGNVKAVSQDGAGIGTGFNIYSTINSSDIIISGGTISAQSENGAGIGSGMNANKTSISTKITISGGIISAKSTEGSGIGTGGNSREIVNTSEITISGGTISAQSKKGTGIGTGQDNYSTSKFSTGTDGNAVIFASAIKDRTGSDSWSGIIFDASDDGILYGNSVEPIEDFDIGSEKTLTIEEGQSLIIAEGVTMTSEGIINNSGKIYVDGTFTGTADNVYYPITLVDAAAAGDTSVNKDKIYGKVGGTITLDAIPQEGKVFAGWSILPSVSISNNSFEMPNKALKVSVQWNDIAAPEILGIENGKTYCLAQTVTVSDNDAVERVTVNGIAVTLDENNQFILSPSEDEQTIVAYDKAENSVKMTVTVNDRHKGGEATCTSKAICKYCSKPYGEVNQHTLTDVPEVPATYEKEGMLAHQHCSVCNKNFINGVEKTDAELTIPKLTRPSSGGSSGGSSSGSYTPPVNADVDDSSLNNAAQTVGKAIISGNAKLQPVGGYTMDDIVKLQKEGKLNLSIEKKAGYASVTDKNLIDNAIANAGGGTNVVYFEISVTLTRSDTGATVAIVSDTEKALTITLDLSADLQKAAKEGKYICVVRVHNGKVDFLDGKLNADKTKITVSSSKFSTYAVVAMEKKVSADTSDSGIMLYGVMALLSLTGGAWVVNKKRKRN